MRKCRCIKKNNFSVNVGNYYYYKIDNVHPNFYPYFIYTNADSHSAFATFSKGFFDVLFIDVNIERKQKLDKLNAN